MNPRRIRKETAKMMKYKVKVDYKSFYFDDRDEAMEFAESALAHSDDDVRVEIEIHLVKGEEE